MYEPDSKKMRFNFLPNDKNLRYSKLKAFVDDELKMPQIVKTLLDREENMVGKGENAGDQHFLLFPQCFLKLSL